MHGSALDRRCLPGFQASPRAPRARNDPLTAHEVLCMPSISSRAIGELLFAVDEFLSEYVESFKGRPGPASVVAMRLRTLVQRLTPGEVLVVEHRVLSRPRKTLREIAAECGLAHGRGVLTPYTGMTWLAAEQLSG